jgi:hypothetical protein
MGFLVAARRFVAPLMVGVLAFAVLMPALGQWLPKSAGMPWLELCTAAGFKRVAGDAPADAPASRHAKDHCPFCRLQQDLPFVPGAAAAVAPPAAPALAAIAVPHPPARTQPRWTLALSQAPPARP